MPIWKLTPTDRLSRDWELSTYKGAIIVRAPSQEEARMRATGVFAISQEARPGTDSPEPPWDQPDLVNCSCVTDSQFDEEGPTVVLSPPEEHRI